MNKKLLVFFQILLDLLSAAIAWSFFYVFRKVYIESQIFNVDFRPTEDTKFWIGLISIPLFWLFLYAIMGTYKNIYRRSRLKELGQTLFISLVGLLFIFFTLILDDQVLTYKSYYRSFFVLFALHFFLTYIPRLIISTYIVGRVHSRKIGFNTVLIGSGKKALDTFLEIENQPKSAGNKFVGYVQLTENLIPSINEHLVRLGNFDEISSIISNSNVEEAILAVEPSEHEQIGRVINALDNSNIIIKITPELSDFLTGTVKMTSIFYAPLIEVKQEIMPTWQQYLKRCIDIGLSLFVLIVLSPLLFLLAFIVKCTSKGPIVYSQERIGKYGKPFNIYKFRSMYIDAEQNGPALSSKSDNRITPIGKIYRKYRFDELPNFYNVLIGDMSLVGPRPERQHFIDQIALKAPHYNHLHKVKAGITSWGQVKYGYAENVDQMIERLRYDLLYIENMSLFVDFKIMIYTVLIVLKGRGK
jgi:exopolysaccharide biosynthesis polyprenyl glycosylphosphotransferase